MERISGLSSEEAKNYLLSILKESLTHDSAVMIRDIENKAKDEANKKAKEFSGGMKRRVALARALAYGGDVLLLDEAFAGIDDPLAEEIIWEICEEYKDKLIIAVTHRPDLFTKVESTILQI